MSKVVLVCSRDPRGGPRIKKLLEYLHAELIPDNIKPNETRIIQNGNAQIAVINPSNVSPAHNGSVLLGHMVGKSEHWWEPGAPAPNGAYGLFRMDEDTIELVTDSLASRTIWYVKTNDVFIASTSQRAIVMLLGSYEPNSDAAVWMLSSGLLGPGNSWDARLRYVEPDSTVSFDRGSWSVRVKSRPALFMEKKLPVDEHRARLSHAVKYSFANIDLDYSKFALTLSGGFDSRGLLMMLKGTELNRCITWGLASSQNDTRNDAYIAKLVACHFGVCHQYFVTDTDKSNESFETIFQRFLVSGEGRVARISGYTDGFSIWKSLFEQDIRGIIRGDMVFGHKGAFTNEFDVRRLARLTVLSDFDNLPDTASLGIPSQRISEHLSRKPGETLETWRDRTYQTHAIPVMLAALTDLKSSYVEVINPLLSNNIVECVRALPDSLRTDKKLWHDIVRTGSLEIPFAETAAPARLDLFLKKQGAVEVMLSELNSCDVPSVISAELVGLIKSRIQISSTEDVKRSRFKRAIRPFAPQSVRRFVRSFRNNRALDINTLAFRALVVCKMSRMLGRDAALHLQS